MFGPDYIIPKPFDPRVLLWVAPAVAEAAAISGVARVPIADMEVYRDHLHKLVERSRGLMQPLYRRARHAPRKPRIVFPDGTNTAIIRAVRILVDEQVCTPVLLGHEWKIIKRAEDLRIDLSGVEIHESHRDTNRDHLAQALWTLRQRRGVTLDAARSMLNDPIMHATMMLHLGLADGMVGGPDRPYKHTLKPALQVLGLDQGVRAVSGVYAMLAGDRKVFFGDCTVNVRPDAETLAEIALNTASVAEAFGQTPRVAMLSYSDFGEHRQDPSVQTVRQAVEIVRQRRPELEIDGEMQADTAVWADKLRGTFPFSSLSGPANVLVMPDLTSGNIAYKLLEHLAGAEVLGPLLVGTSRPVSVIPVHGSVESIVNIATWTANRALDRGRDQ
jgi:malate dehydrogenase (oxaloacetate-decarboxylating)(NADP+)